MELPGHPQEQTWIRENIFDRRSHRRDFTNIDETEQNRGPCDLGIIMVTMVTIMFMRQTARASIFLLLLKIYLHL